MDKKAKKRSSGNYVFRRHDSIGAIDALEDIGFLKTCFIDTGLDILRDTLKPQSIILGRTGSGKTALIEMLHDKETENVVQIDPRNLALTYLSNNSALSFYAEAGINMDLFYGMLWRHIFIVEIIRHHFELTNSVKTNNFLLNLKTKVFPSKSKEKARDYLVEWGESFWQETDYRITEYTQKLERDLNRSAGAIVEASLPNVGKGSLQLNAASAKKLTEEQKVEIARLGQPVVDAVQMRDMTEVISLLEEELLDDKQEKCFITIDQLDEKWVSDFLRYRLIRALLETIRYINYKLPTVKIIIAIREDLISRVFRFTRDSGDQEEKYESLYLRLSWNKAELEQLLDLRIQQLIKDQYTDHLVTLKELLPSKVANCKDPLQYILDRTLNMPRDAIMFVNECIRASENRVRFIQTQILVAEGVYSEKRLKALADEWSADYPNLLPLLFVLKRQNQWFKLNEIDMEQLDKFLYEFLEKNENKQDSLYQLVCDKLLANESFELLRQLMKIFYRIGVIGIKQASYLSIYWSYLGQRILEVDIDRDATYYIHPAFWRVLGIEPIKR